jgi:flagellar assembly protein FliH
MENEYNVISENEGSMHVVTPYSFKRLDLGQDDGSHIVQTHEQEPTPPSKTPQNPSHNEVVTNELVDKMEMLLEDMNSMKSLFDDQNNKLQTHFDIDKQKSYEDGILIGADKAKQDTQLQMDELKGRLIQAIDNINEEATKISVAINNLEGELASVAIDIAKKVIDTELSTQSSNIALNLAHNLIADLNEATNITIKTNIADYSYIKENIKNNEKIKVQSDDAIAQGGVVIISDAGNIDATIKERFKMAKSVLFEEK